VDSDAKYLRLISELKKAKEFVFDTETTSTDALQAQIVGISFCFEPNKAYYVPVEVERETLSNDTSLFGPAMKPAKNQNEKSFPLKKIIADIKPIFENEKIKKYGQNIKYDMLVLSRKGIWTKGIGFDTMVASYVLRSEGQHNLDVLANEYLNYKMVSFDDLTGTGKERKDIRDIPIADVGNYSAEDADITFQLSNILHDRLAAQGMKSLCIDVEFPLIEVLADMEFTGIKIDVAFLSGMSKELERQLDNLVAQIYADAGEKFNINSTQQLSVILFDKLKLAPVRKTKTGFSTDVSVLEALRKEHPIVERMLDYRQLSTLCRNLSMPQRVAFILHLIKR
jgi:DNA polymerase-1